MQNFDPRKQKRLGPAPIASFEKSFEDNNQSHPETTTATTTTGIIDSGCTTQTTHTNRQEGMDTESSFGCKSSNDHQQHEQKSFNPPHPPPLPPMESSITSASNTPSRKITPLSENNNTINKTTPIKIGKKPPLLHSKDSIHDHPLRAPLQSLAPLTPRIDISRASSSSQHEDSRESSPENVFEQVGTGTLQEAVSLGFREEGALDLRTSTEELYFMDPEQKREEQEKIQQARKSPVIFKYDDQQLYLQQHQRKDSASSEVAALLCISGRTSRVSSVGSQGSAVSRLSAISAVSGVSRSPSPHRMLMETSFCGPKPLENVVESCAGNLVAQTAEILENVLLSRTKDLTQVILAEGIKIESSPKKKTLSLNKENLKKKIPAFDEISKIEEEKLNGKNIPSHKILQRKGGTTERRDSTKKIVGFTPTGTEYIRINLKPDHLYADQGVAPNEKIIEAAGAVTADKPSTLQLTKDSEKPKPYSSPKQTRHTVLSKDVKLGNESRSPSPANPGVSRKSSFCSLFKTKDSPDSPRDRSRSKSNDRGSSSHSQSLTPNKQKSVLAIFKPKRSGSKSKSSSPIDHEGMSNLDGISQVEFKFNSETQSANNQEISRPTSRLRYYDAPPDGSIRIPLHTPPEEKETRKIVTGITQEALIKQKEQLRPMSAPTTKTTSSTITSSTNAKQMTTTDSIESVDIISKKIIAVVEHNQPSTVNAIKPLKPKQVENTKRIENLDAIHTLPDDVNQAQRTWSLEVHRHCSQDSQETVVSSENSTNNARKISKSSLDNVIESPVIENGITQKEFPIEESPMKQITTTVTVQQSQQQKHTFQEPKPQHLVGTIPTIQPNGDAISKEKKRILFATRLGSGSQEQIFSTQFSLSKTESLSSQLSEQNSIPESPAETKESLHRTDTVLRRPDDIKKKDSVEDFKKDPITKHSSIKKDSSTEEHTTSTFRSSESIEKRQPVIMRRKDSTNEFRKRNDENDSRHSKYFENLDITKSVQSDIKLNKIISQSSSDKSVFETPINTSEQIVTSETSKPPSPTSHIPPPPLIASDRLSVTSTDEPIDTSESERDTEGDPNCLKQHLPRHLGIVEDHESTGLVSQLSFEDELPYVPTTLPEERPQGVSIIPVKERANMEVKTFSLDRPRSTTPMNPAHLEEFCEIVTPDSDNSHIPVRGEKLRISLPRKDSNAQDRPKKTKSPRRVSNASGKSWFEFAEQGIRGGGVTTTTSSTISNSITTPKDTTTQHQSCKDKKNTYDSPPPPLPPRKPSTTSITSGQWINFENIPEKRKPPKKITALPKESVIDNINKTGNVQYNYVKPEECQCECHDSERDPLQHPPSEATTPKGNSISNVDLLKHSSGEDMQPLLDTDIHDGIYRSDSSQDDYGIDEHQQIINQRRNNDHHSASSNRSSGYSDGNESGERHASSSQPSKHSS